MAIEKIKILVAVLELPAKLHCQFSPFDPFQDKWAGLAVLLQTGPQYFFQLLGVPIIHLRPIPQIFWT